MAGNSLTLDDAACLVAFGSLDPVNEADRAARDRGRAMLRRALENGQITATGTTIAQGAKSPLKIPTDAWLSGPIWVRSALIIYPFDYQVRLDEDAVRALMAVPEKVEAAGGRALPIADGELVGPTATPRTSGRKNSKHEVLEYIQKEYPAGLPAKVPYKTIAFAMNVGERTVRRALGGK